MADLSGADLDGLATERLRAGGMLGPLALAQYGALTRLRWRMFSNGMRTSKGALELGARTFSYLVYGVIGLGIGAGAGMATYGLAEGKGWQYLPIVFWILAFLWQMIPIMLASFQEQFELGILLRFPVRFGSYLLLYVVFGLVDISTILGGLCCLGIWCGMAVAQPGMLLWTTIALIAFALFNILLARAIFAWIERWLAQRKTREIVGAIFMLGLLSLQLLNPALYQKKHSGRSAHQSDAEQFKEVKDRYTPWIKKANAVQRWLPPGLASQSVREAAEQRPMAALAALGVLGVYALAAGGALAFRLRGEYRGENLGVAPSRINAAASRVQVSPAFGVAGANRGAIRRLGGSGPIAAIIEKDLRALIRTLPLLWAIGAPLLMVLVLTGIMLRNGGPQMIRFPFALPLCMVYAQLGFTQIFYNNLGTEGAGIQLYFLSPTPMRTVMMAKNLLHASLYALVAVVAAVLTSLRLGTPDYAILVATIGWSMFSLPCNLAAGNIFSLKMPYRVNPGRISRQRGSQANALLSLLVQLGFMVMGAAVFAIAWLLNRMWLAAPIFLLLAAGALFAWKKVIDTTNSIAFERRDNLMATLMKEG